VIETQSRDAINTPIELWIECVTWLRRQRASDEVCQDGNALIAFLQ